MIYLVKFAYAKMFCVYVHHIKCFCSPFGHYRLKILIDALNKFQGVVKISYYLQTFMLVYIYDMLVFSKVNKKYVGQMKKMPISL